jgi:twitching motility protein PilT
MAHIDRLISVLVDKHADALTLQAGERPALVMAGDPHAVSSTVLKPEHVAQLVAEIAPDENRSSIAAGKPAKFTYNFAGTTVSVEFAAESGAVIRSAAGAGATSAPPAGATSVGAPQASPPSQTAVAVEQPPATAASIAGAETQPAASAAMAPPKHMDELFRQMIEQGASDLHLSSACRPILRVDGDIKLAEGRPELLPETVEKLLREIAPDHNWQQFCDENDSDFAYEIEGLCRFRCNYFRDRKGPGAVFRAIPSKILSVDDLDLAQGIRDLCYLAKGLVLVTGPTGSGKSTTLTALIDLINATRKDHIITIEDPIEFVHENKNCLINQREVNVHTEGFKRALRAALREDPDIVLVGELRDLETVHIALETAETGHLVFGTLHTTSAVSTIDRLIDQFPSGQQGQIRVMLAESMKGVIAQVLCRKSEGKTFQIPSIMQTGRKHGMRTMNESLLTLVKDKLVEPEEAYSKALDRTSLVSAFKAHKIPVDFVSGEGEAKKPERAAA